MEAGGYVGGMKDVGNGRVEIVCARCGKKAVQIKCNAKRALERKGKVHCSRACGLTKHGQATRTGKTKAYECWENMISRCNNPNDTAYVNYGGRGIKVCERWHQFTNFLADMGNPPPGMRIDRIDNDAGYSKENCRWTSNSVQVFNQRKRSTNKTGLTGVTFDRHQGVFKALAIINGVRNRLYRGDDFFEACCHRLSWEARVDPKQHGSFK